MTQCTLRRYAPSCQNNQGGGTTCVVISAAVSSRVPKIHVNVHKLGAELSSEKLCSMMSALIKHDLILPEH